MTPDDLEHPEASPIDASLEAVEDLLRRAALREPPASLDERIRTLIGRRSMAAVRRTHDASDVPTLRLHPAAVRPSLRVAAAAAAILAAGAGIAVLSVGRSNSRVQPNDRPSVAQVDRTPIDVPVSSASRTVSDGADAPLPALWVQRTIDHVQDEGIVGQFGDMPLQRFRRQSVRQVWVVDPVQGARLTATEPREEVMIVRVRPF